MRINNYNVDPSKIFLRSSNNGISYNGFHRKRIGDWNKAEYWTGIPDCKECGGFFGIDKEFHGFGIVLHRPTIEMCEWRGKRISIDCNKVCVSEYRVVAINEDIPDYILKQCGYNILKSGDYVSEISDGKWIIFGGKIGKITGGFQYFYSESSVGNAEITGGVQEFYDESSIGDTKIIGGNQYLHNESSVGNAKIIGGKQHFYNESSAGNAVITGGEQDFWDKSSAGNAIITGGKQHFSERSSAGIARIAGGTQYFYNIFSASNAKITGGYQGFNRSVVLNHKL